MKVKKILFGVVCVVMLFALTGCVNKIAYTTNDFKSKVESLGYATADVTSKYSSYGYVQEVTSAKSSDGFEVEFFVLDTESNAISMFNSNKATFESNQDKSTVASFLVMGNYSSYTLTSGGYYMHICRVDNTLLYVRVKDIYKDSVKSLIKKLGY